MRFFLILVYLALYFAGNSQRKFAIDEAGFHLSNATTKFYYPTIGGVRFYNSKGPMNRTVFCTDAMASISLYASKRINYLVGGGMQIHRVKNDFNDISSDAANNYLWKIYSGMEIFVLGKRQSFINVRLQALVSYEDFLINRTGFYEAIGPFGTKVYVFDYAGNPGRFGLDVLPIINMNLNDKTSISFGVGYSFGLNKSNKRAITLERTWPSSNAQVIDDKKESSFIFSAGVYYNLSKIKHRSFKNWKFSELTNKMFYNQ